MIEWAKIWGKRDSESHLRVIRVKTEYVQGEAISVANAFNGHVWLRRPLNTAVEPGLYTIGLDRGLSRVQGYRGDYPDLEIKMPDFQAMELVYSFKPEDLQETIFALQKIREADMSRCYITREGLFSADYSWNDEDEPSPAAVALEKPEWFRKLPKDEVCLDPVNLEAAMKEMLHYGGEVLLMHPRDAEMPLVFGVSPQACSVIMEHPRRL